MRSRLDLQNMVQSRMVILDCDGVLVDSDPISLQIFAAWLTALGLPTTYEECQSRYLGRSMAASLLDVEERLGRPLPRSSVTQLDDEINTAYRTLLRPVAGVVDALDGLEALGFPYCIGSSSRRHSIELKLRLTGLHERFGDRIFCGTDVERAKPAPDVFIHAARSMGFPVQRCLVVEDSPNGVQAARAAGMPVLGYSPQTSPEQLKDADLLFHRMADLPGEIIRLIANTGDQTLSRSAVFMRN
jgi:beta-phosphoglucomutase-like phosphatase (HAD superfamily)